jgi:CHAT domain-containing protein
VFCSAQEPGLRAIREGEGLVSLRDCVMVTLWPVRDFSSAALSRRLYRHLADGRPPAHTLHSAKRELRAFHLAPLHWAGFVAVGDCR